MELTELLKSGGEWLKGSGPQSEIVISSRIRLARNLSGYPFMTRISPSERRRLTQELKTAILGCSMLKTALYVDMEDADPVDKRFLVERHLISREHENSEGSRGVAVSEGEMIAIMLNEEDHLRLQVLESGLQVMDAWRIMDGLDNEIEEKVDYAYNPQMGYLTACPTNVGTGLRVSVMLHLPALVITRQIEKVFQAVSKMNLAVRGLYGEGTEASGDFYQISNQVTLGKSEDDIIRNIEGVLPIIIRYEHMARRNLLTRDRARLEDRILRAEGILKNARMISSEETMQLLSAIRMGVHLGIVSDIEVSSINQLFIFTQPAHLQKVVGRILEPEERDVRRAEYIREKLNKKKEGG